MIAAHWKNASRSPHMDETSIQVIPITTALDEQREILNDSDEPCGSGEIGQLVITDLHNLGSPVIRYRIGDYVRVGEACSCSRRVRVERFERYILRLL